MIEELVDKFFPIRKDNKPCYRANQRETIIKIVEALKTKKFVCLDGPVGCGKSAINYTVGMVTGSTVYLTHQKQLQDQMVKELWPEVKMVKGRSAYCCNGATLTDERIRCNYSGDRYATCQNSDGKASYTDTRMIQGIKTVTDMYRDNDRVFRMRSGFEVNDNIEAVLGRIQGATMDDMLSQDFFARTIGCNMKAMECPVKSTRALAKVYQIRILNPDVFYMLNRGQSPYFGSSELMVIDECHKIEDVVKRIFGGEIHVEFLNKYFGIDLSELYSCEDITEFTEKFMYLMKTVVLPAKCAAAMTVHMSPVAMHKAIGGSTLIPRAGKSVLINEFISISNSIHEKRKFDMNEFLASVFAGQCNDEQLSSLWMKARASFIKDCEENECDNTFFSTIKNVAWYSEAIEHLEGLVGTMVIPDSFMFSRCKENMWAAYEDSEVIRFVKEQMPDYRRADMDSIKLTPINISGIMNTFFYNKAEHVVLSTGTWVDKVGMMKTFGIKPEDAEFISIPTTFKRERRPVYVLRGSKYMDFSKKNDDGVYEYKTPEGTLSFTSQLGEIIEKVRSNLRLKGLNINVIVHSFSFEIAKKIAEYCPYVDDKWLIQIGKNDKRVENKRTGHVTEFIYKDELVQHMFNHPNSGLTLVASSVSEGVDFKYDVARAQIILKRPIPSLGDPYIMSKYKGNAAFGIAKDFNFLDRLVFTDMMQMYGRVMRAEDDWGITIIYDQSITKSLNMLLSRNGARRVNELGIDYLISAIKGGIGSDGFPMFEWPFG